MRRLVERFSDNIGSYRAGGYNETRVRIEFIDPMFKALGWDMDNEAGYAEAYKEVIHEDAIKIGGATKAPDYCFRIGGTRKFFLEAKKPAVSIRTDPEPAYQLRRYAWSAKLPLSILTDFEEFAVYDCRMRPVQHDKASMGRTLYLKYTDYLDRWDEIASIFSKEAILKGSFDKYAESTRRKRGTAEVDASFLAEIESWRDVLARNIALRNKDLGVRELNQAVQRTVDRILFLRMCEDRGVENYGRLQALLNTQNVYGRLGELFSQADDKYNSGLFHFKSERGREDYDGWTLDLTIDDKVLKGIIKRLYYPECPFEFSVLPADILGHIYEQFLGKVIRLTKGHQAKVEFKPEVRKAGGVYYTPTYIVDYIVKNTVGKLCEQAAPKKVAELRILDPACGSGSFLLGAYQYLLDWHLKWYLDNDPEKHAKGKKPAIYESGAEPTSPNQNGLRRLNWRLTTARRKEILLNNIYGVDIDQQAVEVTKLSLLLKVLEGQTAEGIKQQLALFRERALPDLASNIKCGNSLIGPDFYDGKQMSIFDQDDLYRINAFDWNKEFPEIMGAGGFDAVIGNPPYGAVFSEKQSDYLKKRFETFVWRGESYLAFVEKGVQALKLGGRFGYIIPDTYLNLGFTHGLRKFLLESTRLRQIVSLPPNVFPRSTVDTTLLFVVRAARVPSFHHADVSVKILSGPGPRSATVHLTREFSVPTSLWHAQDAFNVHSDAAETRLVMRVQKEGAPLSRLAELFYGIKAYQVGKGKPPQTKEVRETKPFTAEERKDKSFLPFFDGKHIGRYQVLWTRNNWLKYGPWLAEPRSPEKYEGEKILIRKIVGPTLVATYLAETSCCNTLLFVLKIRPGAGIDYPCLLGILNSRFIGWYFRKKFQISADQLFPQIMIRDVLQFPIAAPSSARHDRMVELVERMLDLHKRLQVVRTEHDKEVLRRQIAGTDDEIDRLVYELYGLTEAEIRIVEATGK